MCVTLRRAPFPLLLSLPQALVRRHLERWCRASAEQGRVLGFPACQQLSLDLAMELVLGVGAEGARGEEGPGGLAAAMRQFVASLFSLPIVLPGTALWKVGWRDRQTDRRMDG